MPRLLEWITKYQVWAFSGFFLITIVGVVWRQWYWLINNHEEFRNVGLILFGLIGAPFAVWRTMIARENTNISLHNSVTDTFTAAIEQLGAGNKDEPKIEVRLGGIYALEKLLERDGYYQTITDIFTSYVRHNTPSMISESNRKLPREDIQAILTILGTQTKPRKNIDFSYCDFSLYSFENTNFSNTNFTRSDFQGAKLYRAKFMDSDLYATKFLKADLKEIDIKDSYVFQASFQGARHFTCEQLKKARHWEGSVRDIELACGAKMPIRDPDLP